MLYGSLRDQPIGANNEPMGSIRDDGVLCLLGVDNSHAALCCLSAQALSCCSISIVSLKATAPLTICERPVVAIPYPHQICTDPPSGNPSTKCPTRCELGRICSTGLCSPVSRRFSLWSPASHPIAMSYVWLTPGLAIAALTLVLVIQHRRRKSMGTQHATPKFSSAPRIVEVRSAPKIPRTR